MHLFGDLIEGKYNSTSGQIGKDKVKRVVGD